MSSYITVSFFSPLFFFFLFFKGRGGISKQLCLGHPIGWLRPWPCVAVQTRCFNGHLQFNVLSMSVVDGDPHFMIEIPDRDDALCFNINDKPGTIFNLVTDPKSGQH